MFEFLIAWAIMGFMLFVILGGVGLIMKSLGDERAARLCALSAVASLVWPIVLVVGVVYIVLWTIKQAADSLWTLNEEENEDEPVQDG